MTATAYRAPRIFDGTERHKDKALIVERGTVRAIVPAAQIPGSMPTAIVAQGQLVPGFVDLQVNGGGGVLLNDEPDVGAIRQICRAHAAFGTTALLPTLITARPDVTRRAIAAGREAARLGVPGFVGLHLEGPHLSVARKGAHDQALIRPMDEDDCRELIGARETLPTLLTTVAPESAPLEAIRRLAAGGVVVSLGHTDADARTCRAAFAAGATMTTHLFNAMSQLANREPGLVGATLEDGHFAGLIADGIHVEATTMRLALRAQRRAGRLLLVTDAMSTIGTALDRFTLDGRTILRRDGALRLADGTLAGADLTMIDAVLYAHRALDVEFEEALRMASLYPARAIGRDDRLGHLQPGAEASFLHLGDDAAIEGVWIAGKRVA